MLIRRLLPFLVLGYFAVAGVFAQDDDLLRTLKPTHPRLLASADSWSTLRDCAKTDPTLAKLLAKFEAEGRALFARPPVEYRKTGRRLLHVSRQALRRVLLLSFNYRLTGDDAFLRRAEHEMLAVAAFTDWNPSHFLDVGEMTTALALGYDWLHDALPPESVKIIRAAIVEKSLRPGSDPDSKYLGWQRAENNWNSVCFGGLTLGALAVAEDEPELARQILTLVKANNPRALKSYAPDGVYPEGPSYWSYGTNYQVMLIAALESALGTDWGLASSPGFLTSAAGYVQTTAPSGDLFNFFDGREKSELEPAFFWMARKQHDPGLLFFQQHYLSSLTPGFEPVDTYSSSRQLLPLVALWWPETSLDPASPAIPRQPQNWLGRGPNPLAIFRSSWTDPTATYLAVKGGNASLSHGHMDAGSFILEMNGVRWVRDLGLQPYESLESKGIDLWKRGQDSPRWKVFRLNNHSHSTLTIDGQLHRFDGAANIVRFSDTASAAHAVIDLSPVFAGQAGKVIRGFRLARTGEILVQDELSGLKPGAQVCWAIVTNATVEPAGSHATLRESGKTLTARIVAPAGAAFEVIDAAPPESYDAPNPDTRLIILNTRAPASGELRIAIILSAGDEVTGLAEKPHAGELTSPETWSAPVAP